MSVANPESVLDAVLNPAPLTLGALALLEKVASPFVVGGTPDLADGAIAIWVFRKGVKVCAPFVYGGGYEGEALAYYDGLTYEEGKNALAEFIASLEAFNKMLPRGEAEGDTKKNA